jgi:hypothetical protein
VRSSIKGIAPEWYTLSADEGETEPVQFYLKPIDGMAWTAVLMESYNAETGEIGANGISKAFTLGVKGWRNIEDGNKPGEPLKFSRQAMTSMHPGWIMEVGQRVLEISKIDEATAKNSDSPLS